MAHAIADLGDLYAWSAVGLGQCVELLWIEQVSLGIRTFRCIDKTEAEIDDYYRQRKRERDRVAKQKDRARAPVAQKVLSDRAKDLLSIMQAKWISATELTEAAADLRSFRRRARAKPLDLEARRQAVHRAIKELHGAGEVDLDKVDNERDQRITVVRLHV